MKLISRIFNNDWVGVSLVVFVIWLPMISACGLIVTDYFKSKLQEKCIPSQYEIICRLYVVRDKHTGSKYIISSGDNFTPKNSIEIQGNETTHADLPEVRR